MEEEVREAEKDETLSAEDVEGLVAACRGGGYTPTAEFTDDEWIMVMRRLPPRANVRAAQRLVREKRMKELE